LRSDTYVDAIRTDGYAIRDYNRFTNTPGRTSSIAVPVFHHGEVYAALTLVYFAVSMDREKAVNRYVADLRSAAAAITLRLAERHSSEPLLRRSKTYVESPQLGVAQ
jgi:IclR family mhp operon transcriptional activator